MSTDILSAFLAGITCEDCARIDRFFAQPNMRKLEHVAWHIFDYHPVRRAVDVGYPLAKLFPKLTRRRRLRWA